MGGEGMEHSEEGYGRYPPRDYSGPGDRGHYEGHGAERGRGRGFVSSCLRWSLLLMNILAATDV